MKPAGNAALADGFYRTDIRWKLTCETAWITLAR